MFSIFSWHLQDWRNFASCVFLIGTFDVHLHFLMGLGLKTYSEKGQLGGSNANVYGKYINTPTLVSRLFVLCNYEYEPQST